MRFCRFIVCILQMAFAFFHILFFLLERPPRFTSQSMFYLALGITGLTLGLGLWNIYYHANYLYNPVYDIFFELLMMLLIPLEGFLFVFYLRTDEHHLLSHPQATLSGPASNSYPASHYHTLNPQAALNATMREDDEGTTILVEESLDQDDGEKSVIGSQTAPLMKPQ